MEEEKENNQILSEEDSLELNDKIKNTSQIDLGKAMVVVFMITACLCGILGFYIGMQYAVGECNADYSEFFSNHYCVEGKPQLNNNPQARFDLLDFNITEDNNVK